MDKRKILLVDDEVDLLKSMQKRLRQSNFEFIVASDGQEGLEKARHEQPDLIILDLLLPKLNGYKVCRLLKFDVKYENIPIVIFTSKGQEKDKILGYQVGADAYFTKAKGSKVMLGKIKELLERKIVEASV